MINTYFEPPNPCGFCSHKQNEELSEKKQDFLQVNLDGNDTTLFIRETSIEDFRKIKEEETIPVDEVIKDCHTVTVVSSFIGSCSRTRTVRSDWKGLDEDNNAQNKQIDNLYIKKWSGYTYFEEEFRKIQEKSYQKGLAEAKRRQKLWKSFQKDIAKDRKRDLITSSGPEWWQEPSGKQICLVISLGDVINTDYEEEVTGRTRQLLLDLGVTTKIKPMQVRACMRKSLLNPIDFLLEVHAIIVRSEINIKKKKGDLQRPFSINERLILSAMCVLHLPTLLTMLHYILPPPTPWPTEKHKLEHLFGSLEDEQIRYSTPYMEPLPFRSQTHLHNWAFDKVFRALLPLIIADEKVEVLKDRKDTLVSTIPTMELSVRSQRKITVSEDLLKESLSISEQSESDSISWLLSQCISKREMTQSLYPYRGSEIGQPKIFNRKLTIKSVSQNKTPLITKHGSDDEPRNMSYAEDNVNEKDRPTYKDKSGNLLEAMVLPEVKSTLERKSSLIYQAELLDKKQDPNVYSEIQSKTLPSRDLQSQETYFETGHKAAKIILNENVEIDEDKFKMDRDAKEFHKIWDELSSLPKKNQLHRAIEVLQEMGDPLARLPQVHKLPSIQRWLELRQGKSRTLSKDTKSDLLTRSRGMWKLGPVQSTVEGPKVKCSKRFERLLTWDKKKWLKYEVDEEMRKYFSRVRQEKVDNSRAFFPSMLNHYDHGSKLNRSFRDVFYTYLPAREADTFVYKPWQPMETKNKKT